GCAAERRTTTRSELGVRRLSAKAAGALNAQMPQTHRACREPLISGGARPGHSSEFRRKSCRMRGTGVYAGSCDDLAVTEEQITIRKGDREITRTRRGRAPVVLLSKASRGVSGRRNVMNAQCPARRRYYLYKLFIFPLVN